MYEWSPNLNDVLFQDPVDLNHWMMMGCVGWWKVFPCAMAGYKIRDLSVYKNDGTLTGMDPAADWTFATGRPALSLNGSSKYISIPDSDRYSFTTGAADTPFTISAWVRMTDATNFRLISKASGSASEWFFGTNPSDGVGLACYTSTTATSISRGSNSAVTSYENTWTMFSASYTGSGANTGMALYVNGAPIASTGATSGTYTGMVNTTTPVEIGRLILSQYANGYVDDVRLWNRCLSATEMWNIFVDSSTGRYEPINRLSKIAGRPRPAAPVFPSASDVWHGTVPFGPTGVEYAPSKVGSSITNLSAGNVKSGVAIDDVTGSYGGGGSTTVIVIEE